MRSFRTLLAGIDDFLGRYYAGPWRRSLAREQRDREDLFMLLVFSESLGIPNPAAWYTLELRGLMLEEFHAWHLRQGMDRSPLDDFRCC